MENSQPSINSNLTETVVQQPFGSYNSRILVVVVISVLLTALAAGLVVYFWQRSANEKAISSLEQKISSLEEQVSPMKEVETAPQPTSSPALSPTPITDPTANWKTYKNEKYGYSIKYLSGPEFQQIECDNNFVFNIKGDSSYNEASCGPRDAYFSIEIHGKEGDPFSQEEYPSDTPSIKVISEDITIGEITGKKFTLIRIKPAPVPEKTYQIIFYRNGVKYTIFFIAFDHEEIFNSMISTFKFLN